MPSKIKKQKVKVSECCKAPMIGGVQCENCGSNGKFTSNTAIVRKLEAILKAVAPTEKFAVKAPEQATGERFVDCGDYIKDTWEHTNPQTGEKYRLIWDKVDAPAKLTNEVGGDAETYCSKVDVGGFKDWKLPERWELETLLDLSKRDPACDKILNMKTDDWYWTKTARANSAGFAWHVNFNSGFVSYCYRYYAFYVRPCRQY